MSVYERFKTGGERLEESWGRPVAVLRRGAVEWAGEGWIGSTKSDQITAEGVRLVVKHVDVFLRDAVRYLPQKEAVI